MGKSLVTTLLKRHVNIYSDLYTLCFLHSYIQSPQRGAGPQGHDTAPSLRLPILWYQVFGQQSKLVLELISPWHHLSGAEAAFSRSLERLTSPRYHCSPEDKAPTTRTQAYGSQEADKTNTGKLGPLSLACLLTSHSPASRHCAKVAGRGLGPTCGRA